MPRPITFTLAFLAALAVTREVHALRQAPNACVAVVSAVDASDAEVSAAVRAEIHEAATDTSNCVGSVLRTDARYQRARVRITTDANGVVRTVSLLEGGRAFRTCARRLRGVTIGPDAAASALVLTLRVGLRRRGVDCVPTDPSPAYEAALVVDAAPGDRLGASGGRRLRPHLSRIASDVARCLSDGDVPLESGETALVVIIVTGDEGARIDAVRGTPTLDRDLESCLFTALSERVPARRIRAPSEVPLRLALRRLPPPT